MGGLWCPKCHFFQLFLIFRGGRGEAFILVLGVQRGYGREVWDIHSMQVGLVGGCFFESQIIICFVFCYLFLREGKGKGWGGERR